MLAADAENVPGIGFGSLNACAVGGMELYISLLRCNLHSNAMVSDTFVRLQAMDTGSEP